MVNFPRISIGATPYFKHWQCSLRQIMQGCNQKHGLENFSPTLYVIAASTFTYALLMLLKPVFIRVPASGQEREKARKIVEQYGCSSLAAFTLLNDKSYFFSPSGHSVIAYVPKGRGAIALGDPIGPIEDRKEVIVSFQQFCQRNDWYPAFYQTLPDHLNLYQLLGFKV